MNPYFQAKYSTCSVRFTACIFLLAAAACSESRTDCGDDFECNGPLVCDTSQALCVPPSAPPDGTDAGNTMRDAGIHPDTKPETTSDAGTNTASDAGTRTTSDAGTTTTSDAGSLTGIYQPLSAQQYQAIIGRGLAASWFKQAPPTGYQAGALVDFKERGFDNVRLRLAAEIYTGDAFSLVEQALDDCIQVGLVPIISWVNHEAESAGTDEDKQAYVAWWTEVATRLQGKSYTIGFNLFTEIGNQTALNRVDTYNDWTSSAVQAIRAIDPQRIILLAAPSKTVDTLTDIAPAIYEGDGYMLAEWHLYASGPNQNGGHKNWVGEGSVEDRLNVTSMVDQARRFTANTGLPTYFGAWMPMDNNSASLVQNEVEAFARFFLETLSADGIPWTVNAVQHYYDIATNTWLENRSWGSLTLQMPPIVDILVGHADFGEGVTVP